MYGIVTVVVGVRSVLKDHHITLILDVKKRLRSHVKTSCFVFHRGFQTPRNSVGTVLEPLMKHEARVFEILLENPLKG